MMYTIIVSFLWAVGTGYLAKKKGLNIILWGVIGGATWIMGLLLCWAYSSYNDSKKTRKFKTK